MDKKNFLNKSLIRYGFGWNYRAWSHSLKTCGILSKSKYDRVLEIGAGKHSIVSLIFDGIAEEIVVSYYEDKQMHDIESYLNFVKKKKELKSTYILKKLDAKTVIGNYDLVIMKSVLGGIYRNNNGSLLDIKVFIKNLFSRTVKNGGILITIDNGKSFFENFMSSFGARKNQWRFFLKDDLNFSGMQFYFGFLSSFSFEMRLGIFGFILDNYIMYPLDYFLSKILPNNPTVILNIVTQNINKK